MVKLLKTCLCFLALCLFTNASTAESLRVSTIERSPFAYQTESGDWEGFSVDLVREIATREDLQINFVKANTFADMLEQVKTQQADLAAANISVTRKREQDMDFSQPIYESGLQILVPQNSKAANMFKIIWESGILLFLGGAFVVLMIVAHLVWFFERGANAKHDYFNDAYLPGIWDAFWWAFIVVTMGGFENERPEHYIGRVLAVFWVLTSLFFVSVLTAQITTALTVAQLSSSISSYEDLRGKKVGAAKGTTISAFLDRHHVAYTPYDDFADVLKDLENGKLEAAVGSAAVSQHYASNKGKGLISTAGEVFARDQLALAFPENSPYFEKINGGLIGLKQDGTFDRLRRQYFGE
ncbi:MAG: transporter substrate-binding domain-containing protein [Alphaproteobacteria bacterium]